MNKTHKTMPKCLKKICKHSSRDSQSDDIYQIPAYTLEYAFFLSIDRT